MRSGRCYVQVSLEDPKTGEKKVRRLPLGNPTTPPQAKAALDEILVRGRKGQANIQKRASTTEHHALIT